MIHAAENLSTKLGPVQAGAKVRRPAEVSLLVILSGALAAFGAGGLVQVANPPPAEAHWICSTHEYLAQLAFALLREDREVSRRVSELLGQRLRPDAVELQALTLSNGKVQACSPLWPGQSASERTLLEFVLQGLRDADLRVNGIFAIDEHCSDPRREGSCPPDLLVTNNMAAFVIGDHGYDPRTGRGFYSDMRFLQEEIERVARNANDPRARKLLARLQCDAAQDVRRCIRDALEREFWYTGGQVPAADHLAHFLNVDAISSWQSGRRAQAAYLLGMELHLVQDVTVPHHVRLVRGRGHAEYERGIWVRVLGGVVTL